ncbi:MAG: hypothetical protein M3O24_02730 [Thermoproteota archaeon]|nr:hypothetical protein [Thermoproteota archaeon]
MNYVQVQQKFLDSLLSNNDTEAKNLVYNLITSDVTKEHLLVDVILPTINIVDNLYNRGRLGESERLSILTFAMDLVALIRFDPYDTQNKLRAHSLSVAGSEDSVHFAKIASTILYLSGWNSTFMGNVELKIDPFFDIDIQRYVLKMYGNRNGLILVLIFSFSESTLRFLCNAFKNLKARFAGDFRLLLFTREDLYDMAQTLGPDFVSSDLGSLIKWIEQEYKKSYG